MLVSRESPPKAESPPFPLFLHWRHWLTAGNESGYIRPSCAFFMSREHNSFQLLSPCKRSTAWSPCLRQKARLCFGAVFSFLTAHPPLTVAIDCFLLTRTLTLTPVVVAVDRGARDRGAWVHMPIGCAISGVSHPLPESQSLLLGKGRIFLTSAPRVPFRERWE